MTVRSFPLREIVLPDIPRAVRRSGFDPGEMKLVARGAVEETEGGSMFRIRHWRQLYEIKGAPKSPGGEIEITAQVATSDRRTVLRIVAP